MGEFAFHQRAMRRGGMAQACSAVDALDHAAHGKLLEVATDRHLGHRELLGNRPHRCGVFITQQL